MTTILHSHLVPSFIVEQYQRGNLAGSLNGAAIFVDFSGFTALTERLMQHGPEGAEILSSLLNQLYDPLVRKIHSQGGFISTYAGDAFTAVFPGDAASEMTMRALSAARFIQQYVRDNVPITTSLGTFELGVKVGVAVGSLQWRIIGADNRLTYIVEGEVINACALAEHQASAGEIIVSAGVAEALAEQKVELQARGTFYLVHKTHLENPDLPIHDSTVDATILRQFVLDRVIDLADSGEFRAIASVFIAVEMQDEVERDAFILNALTISNTYGGYFNKVDSGDKGTVLVLLFGAPVAFENNLANALAFLMRLRADFAVGWRAGVTYGTVYAGFVGSEARNEYTALGDSMNLAARLMMAAPWGQIWVNDASLTPAVLRQFHFSPEGPKNFRGKSAAVDVSSVHPRDHLLSAGFGTATRMVARDAEFSTLKRFVEPLQQRQFAGVAALHAEAGMGKSRLVFELEAEFSPKHHWRWLRFAADEVIRGSLYPIRQGLRSYFGQLNGRSNDENLTRFEHQLTGLLKYLEFAGEASLAQSLERTRGFLADLLGLRLQDTLVQELEPQLRLENTIIGVKSLLQAESLRQPIVIVMEDFQWFDRESRAILLNITRNVEKYPLAVLVTSRLAPDGSMLSLGLDEDTPQEVLELRTLEAAEVGVQIETLLGAAADEKLIREVYYRSNGNPFFVEQLALDFQDRGLLAQRDGRWHLNNMDAVAVPSSITEILIARLDRLEARVKQVVQTAAVLGQQFDMTLLSEILLGREDIKPLVDQAQTERIWTSIDQIRYLFRHVLMRDAAYEMQLRSRLRQLHKLAASALEKLFAGDLGPYLADLIYHYRQAGLEEKELHFLREFIEYSRIHYANDDLIRAATRALELVGNNDPDLRFSLLKARAEACEILSRLTEQLDDLNAMKDLAEVLDNREYQIQVSLSFAEHYRKQSNLPDAEKHVGEAYALANEYASAKLKAQVAYQLGYIIWQHGKYGNALPVLEEAIELATALEDNLILGKAHMTFGTSLMYLGRYDESIRHLELSRKILLKANDRRAATNTNTNLGSLYFLTGNYKASLEAFERSFDEYNAIGDRYGANVVGGNIGALYIVRQELSKAVSAISRAIEVAREIGQLVILENNLFNLGMVQFSLGNLEEAVLNMEQSVALATRLSIHTRMVHGMGGLARFKALVGEFDDAHELVKSGIRIASEANARPQLQLIKACEARVLELEGRLADAERVYREAIELAQEIGETHILPEPQGGIVRVLMRQGKHQEARPIVQSLVDYLNGDPAISDNPEPAWIFNTLVEYFDAETDSRADDMLKQGYDYITRTALSIDQDEKRHVFWTRNEGNRKLKAMYDARFGSAV